ncbi:hypothetical protein GCM10020295_03190 [Streptomyces cinereospinus]
MASSAVSTDIDTEPSPEERPPCPESSSPCASPTWRARSPSTPGSSAPSPPSGAKATPTSPSPSPPLKLVLVEGEAGEETRLDHLGVEVATTQEVNAAATRLRESGLATFEENDTSCCYALQDKVWVTGPGQEPWEVYVVKADAGTLEKADASPDACCGAGACRTPEEQALDPARSPARAKAAAGCACGSRPAA